MSIFEIEGRAKREVECDVADIRITFLATGYHSHEVSGKVMDQCDSFLEDMSKAGFDLKDIHLDHDSVSKDSYHDKHDTTAERSINVRIPYEMKTINLIQDLLQKGRYDYTFSIDGDISDRLQIRTELAKEALRNSRHEAEALAEVLGVKLKGVDSIRKNSWDDECVLECAGAIDCIPVEDPGISDQIGVKRIEESVELKVKWIMED
ncbi:MAG: SIMPL domain-containing protein [Lachnospiraceae bacterium]|nr:SIMPL domain-containing protein [Lachnospiraceae bacterium]